ncbi:protein kinase domain-containing protein [Streptomyces sp. NPDC055103]
MGEVLGPLREGTPRQIGPYEVLARLGAGGMGEVFLARGAADGVYVALKTVRRDVAGDPAFRDRFRREIRVAALVSSPYAAAPVGGDADADVPWLATAYVPGPSLSQAVRRGGPLPVATVRAVGADVARALADLHGAGVLHRDLKPGNVMLSVDGPRLIDFGIARSSTATTMTATGMMVGTPAFMSPEHVAGARRVTTASDVFCLGSLLCYAATGEDPFGDGPLAAVLYRVSQAEADLSRVPEELRGTVAACLALDPADRPAPEELAELLGGDAGRRFPWPEGVRDHIGEYGTELAQLIASGGPLLEVPATPSGDPRGPVVTPEVPGLHSVPTQGPVARPDAPPRRRRGRVLAAVLALAVVAGGLGTYLLWPEGEAEKPSAPSKAAPPAGPRVPGVDDRGLADSSGVVPQNAAQRPAGWKPWRAKLSAPAYGCSAGEKVLVCRMVDGRYEALDPASGKKLWSTDAGSDRYPQDSYTSGSGGVFIAGGSTRPTVHDGVVALVSGELLQVRDARTGAVRWEKKAAGDQFEARTRPLVGDGTVFVSVDSGDDDLARRFALEAYALSDGRRLWTKSLTNASISRAEALSYEPVAYARGTVYAVSDGGLVAYDGKTGTLRGQVDHDAKTCLEIKVLGSSAYCAEGRINSAGTISVHLLDAATLATKGTLPAPQGLGPGKGRGPSVISANTVAAFDGGLKLFDPRSGRQTGSFAAKAAPQGLSHSWSSPLLAGDRIVYADYSAVYSVRLGPDGTPAGLKVTPVPGAPGPRAAEEDYDPQYGNLYAKQIREPEVLPVGGIAYVVFDKGVVASVELPE